VIKTGIWTLLAGLGAVVTAASVPLPQLPAAKADSLAAPQPVTVAFIADQGLGESARAVLRLIAAEGADLVLHQGDLDYRDDPDAWDDMITDELGADFPYFVSIGNHDVSRFFSPGGYQHKLETRLKRIEEARCSGELGVRSACTFRGLFFILSGLGTVPNRPRTGRTNRTTLPLFATNWRRTPHAGGSVPGTRPKGRCSWGERRMPWAGTPTRRAAGAAPSLPAATSTPTPEPTSWTTSSS
jgi:hypothetical protein